MKTSSEMKVVYYSRLTQKDTEKLSGVVSELLERIKSNGLNPDDYAFYLDLRKYGSFLTQPGLGLNV